MLKSCNSLVEEELMWEAHEGNSLRYVSGKVPPGLGRN